MKKSEPIKLRPYQTTDIENIEKAWDTHRSVLYQLPTGGGKSVVLTKLVSDYPDEQIIIFAHKRRLLTQLHERLNGMGIKTGILFGQRSEDLDSPVVVVSIRTAVNDKRLEKLMLREWNRVIIDEARHSRTSSYDKVLTALVKKYPMHKLLGVDATPHRKDGKRLDKHFQVLVNSGETTASLIDKGFLSKYKTFQSPIDKESLKEQVKENSNDYQSTELSGYMRQPKYLEYIVDTYKKFGEEKQAIAFAVDLAHAKDLRNCFINHGGYKPSEIVQIDSRKKPKEIDAAFAGYEKKEIQILINVEMITEGVDLPDTGCIIGARPTKSLTLYLQIVGRGTRIKNDGSDLIVLDCCGWTEEYGTLSSPKTWSLNPDIDPNNPRKGNKIVGRNAAGEYTEDLTEFVGEIVEMTAEEYIRNLSKGLEYAEEENKSIDDKIQDLLTALAELIVKLMKDGHANLQYKVSINYRRVKIEYFHKSIKKDEYNYRHHSIDLEFEKDGDTSEFFPQMNYGYDKSETKNQIIDLQIALGKMSEVFNNKKKLDGLEDDAKGFISQITDLEESKINLDEFKEQARRFKREQWEKKIDDHFIESSKFMFEKTLRYNAFFRDYSRGFNIEGVEFPKGKINKTNNIMILHKVRMDRNWRYKEENKPEYTESRVTETREYIKIDKIHELLKAGKWGEVKKEELETV